MLDVFNFKGHRFEFIWFLRIFTGLGIYIWMESKMHYSRSLFSKLYRNINRLHWYQWDDRDPSNQELDASQPFFLFLRQVNTVRLRFLRLVPGFNPIETRWPECRAHNLSAAWDNCNRVKVMSGTLSKGYLDCNCALVYVDLWLRGCESSTWPWRCSR
jgi:hypothetical protein